MELIQHGYIQVDINAIKPYENLNKHKKIKYISFKYIGK